LESKKILILRFVGPSGTSGDIGLDACKCGLPDALSSILDYIRVSHLKEFLLGETLVIRSFMGLTLDDELRVMGILVKTYKLGY
jgi:hypothetical protein